MLNVYKHLQALIILAVFLVSSTSYSERPQHVLNTTQEEIAKTTTTSQATLSYKEWKQKKVTEIENRIQTLREKLSDKTLRKVGSASGDPNLKLPQHEVEAGLQSQLQQQLEREMLILSMSQDLTISDYFVGYLTKQTSLDVAIREVSARMTPDEVADLMVAFAEHFFQSRPMSEKKKNLEGQNLKFSK